MKILGISHDLMISSAALLIDGIVVAAIAEERLNRIKRCRVFPRLSVEYCLRDSKTRPAEIDYITQPWNPGIHMEKFHPLASGQRRYRHEYLYSVPDHLLGCYGRPAVNYIQQVLAVDEAEIRILYLPHHFCHAANAFYLSPFEESAILTVDGRGEKDTACLFFADGKDIHLIDSIPFPDSLGSFYSAYTEYLGFQPESDEWKVMALAATVPAENEYTDAVRATVNLLQDTGRFELDRTLYTEHLYELPHYYSEKFVSLFGKPRAQNEEVLERHAKIAAAMQLVAEEVVFHLLNHLQKVTRSKHVCCGGGFFLNSVVNGKLCRKSAFRHSFISSCPDDSGLSIGGALYAFHQVLGGSGRQPQQHDYWGPAYSDEEIHSTIKRAGLDAMTTRPQSIDTAVAELLARQCLVGWFQGRSEFGQRALGSRSILADPRDADAPRRLRIAVKEREPFRPFAPAVLEEYLDQYFEVGPEDTAPFMQRVFRFKPDARKLVPAVVHADASGRPQAVSRQTNPLFHNMIERFAAISKVPLVLNTSFNRAGEPIVESPEDALRTFMTTGLNHLAIGSFLLSKPVAGPSINEDGI